MEITTEDQYARKIGVWREEAESCAVKVKGDGDARSEGEVFLRHWSAKERKRRALKWLGICWGSAVAALLIPVLHFVLVPLFLLVGPVAFFIVKKQESFILGGHVPCPCCGEKFQVIAGLERWPLQQLCQRCSHFVTIKKE